MYSLCICFIGVGRYMWICGTLLFAVIGWLNGPAMGFQTCLATLGQVGAKVLLLGPSELILGQTVSLITRL